MSTALFVPREAGDARWIHGEDVVKVAYATLSKNFAHHEALSRDMDPWLSLPHEGRWGKATLDKLVEEDSGDVLRSYER